VPRASTDLAANLAAAEVCCVHVGIGQTVAHGFQSGIEIARVNPLRRGPGDICCRNGSRDGSFSCRRARRLTAAAAQENHDATRDLARCEVQVRHSKRR
jgi:hypothetical protein